MVIAGRRTADRPDIYRRSYAGGLWEFGHSDEARHEELPWWPGSGESHEDAILDEAEQLPRAEDVDGMLAVLSRPQLKLLAHDTFIAGLQAVRANKVLELARTLNTWAATAEEHSKSRAHVHRMLKDREAVRKLMSG